MSQKGSFWNWCKMIGIIKPLKCCQNLYQVVVGISMPCRAFFKWWPWVALDHFYDRVNFVSICFCMGDSLYSIECSYISKFVLIQHILSTQVSDTGPVVLWFSYMFYLLSFFLRYVLIKHGILLTNFARVEFEYVFSFVSLLFISLLWLFLWAKQVYWSKVLADQPEWCRFFRKHKIIKNLKRATIK